MRVVSSFPSGGPSRVCVGGTSLADKISHANKRRRTVLDCVGSVYLVVNMVRLIRDWFSVRCPCLLLFQRQLLWVPYVGENNRHHPGSLAETYMLRLSQTQARQFSLFFSGWSLSWSNSEGVPSHCLTFSKTPKRLSGNFPALDQTPSTASRAKPRQSRYQVGWDAIRTVYERATRTFSTP